MRLFLAIACLTFLYACTNATEQPHQPDTLPAKVATDTIPRNYSPEKAVKELSGKEESITVSYSAISCECAQWMIDGESKQQDTTQPGEQIFLSRANTALPNADTLWDGVTLPLQLKLTGRFYKGAGYPPGYKPVKGDPEPARVFQYSRLEVVRNR